MVYYASFFFILTTNLYNILSYIYSLTTYRLSQQRKTLIGIYRHFLLEHDVSYGPSILHILFEPLISGILFFACLLTPMLYNCTRDKLCSLYIGGGTFLLSTLLESFSALQL
ncbi:hypothetical protein BJV82DRAFT_13364 [Fennellomyces sp. T-0311]|nr:hypothetical protein BJV82DRAFT_13364 [Fennellomyces sp. T-0311]